MSLGFWFRRHKTKGSSTLRLPTDSAVLVWLGLSLAVTLYYGGVTLHYTLSQDYLVQEDARQHIFWMQRYLDPSLFPQDLIARYFQDIAPTGYAALYWLLAQLGIEPLTAAKLLPLGLGLITSAYCFALCLELFPVPMGAFLATILLNQNLWLKDDLASATSRAFLYPLFLAFLFYLLRRQLLPLLVAIFLQGLFYPPLVLVECGILTVRLLSWRGQRLSWSQNPEDYRLWLAGCGLGFLVLLPFLLGTSQFGPTVTAAQMKRMPEFGPGGRAEYFVSNPVMFWLREDSGLHPPVYPPAIWCSLLLPVLLRSPLPLVRQISPQIRLLTHTLLASGGLFLLAHVLLLRLYLPNRYTQHSLRIVMAIAAGITLTILLDAGWRWYRQQQQRSSKAGLRPSLTLSQYLILGIAGLLGIASLVVPAIPSLFLSGQYYIVGQVPQLYDLLRQQPQETLVASLAPEADNLPTFTQRSILVSREYALPFHLAYYDQIHQRIVSLIEAQYTADPQRLQQFIARYGVDYFLLDQRAFTPEYLSNNPWLQQYQPVTKEAIRQLRQGSIPILARRSQACTVLATRELILVDAACVATSPEKTAQKKGGSQSSR